MLDVIGSMDLKPAHLASARIHRHLPPPRALARTPRAQAVQLLSERRFAYAGEDAMGLPCFRSPTGAILIAVGSTRCLAYAKVQGKLQVVAAARTTSLLCRIAPESEADTISAAPPDDDMDLFEICPHAEARLLV